ncbi:MAG: LamG domain-containing protein [Solirubrobacteraceae bacterium]
MIRGRSSTLLGFIVTAAVAVPSAAFVMQRTLDTAPEHRMELTSSTGALTIANSRDGQAILTAAPMVPGTSTSGTINLENTGDSTETLTLDAGQATDSPGPGGGRLSQRLVLRVEDVSTSVTQTVYSGPLTQLDLAALGTLDKHERRTYRFVVTFPDGGANGADNAYQGSSASIDFEWLIAAGGPATPPADAPLEQQVAADAPQAYWPLDGSQSEMNDISGNHTGAWSNTVTTAPGTAPGGGKAAFFDGEAGYGYVNGLAAFTQAYTVEAWVNPADSSDMTIVEHGGVGSLTIENGQFVFRHLGTAVTATGSSSSRGSSSLAGSSESSATPGTWHLVIGTWNVDGSARLYVDGALVARATVSGTPSGNSTFFVGRGNTLANSFFHGAMAQVAYYGSDLDADRVNAHWQAGKVAATAPPVDPGTTDPGTTDPGTPSTPSTDPGTPPTQTPTQTNPDQPSTTCPGSVAAQGGQSSMWAILNARAKARAKAKAKALAKAKRAKARGTSRGKTRQKPRVAKKTKRTTCAGARAKGSSRSG